MRNYFERGGVAAATGESSTGGRPPARAADPAEVLPHGGQLSGASRGVEERQLVPPVPPWIVFFQNVDAIIGPDDPIIYPAPLTDELDYELELAVVIGKAGSYFSPEEAEDYIAGYVIFNDITARDIQRSEMKSGVFSLWKSIDTFCPLGPWIVTPDEIPDPARPRDELRVNGERQQFPHRPDVDDRRRDRQPLLAARLQRRGHRLDRHGLGGRGVQRRPASHYLKPGDVVEAEIEQIGVLRNPVIPWEDAHGSPAPEKVRWIEEVEA